MELGHLIWFFRESFLILQARLGTSCVTDDFDLGDYSAFCAISLNKKARRFATRRNSIIETSIDTNYFYLAFHLLAMKIMILLLILATCLSYAVSALPVTTIAGPFNVSFDINTTKKLINQPQYSDTRKGSRGASVQFYGLEIIDSNTPNDAAEALIGIYEYDTPISDSLENKAEQTAKLFHVLHRTVSVDYRTIDGNPGYVVKAVNENGRIEYSSGYRIGKQIEVTIIGALPEITSLLDTIHIEETSIRDSSRIG